MPSSRRLTPIDARNTSMVIADQIRDRIIDGSYAPGEQINAANVLISKNLLKRYN